MCPAQVAALHVHERAPANGTDLPWDLALLVLKSPVTDSTLPCVDLGRAQPILPPLATGDVGVVSARLSVEIVSSFRFFITLYDSALETA